MKHSFLRVVNARLRFFQLLFALLALLGVNGCAALIPPPQSDGAALQQISRWVDRNGDLKQFKSLMRIQIQAQDDSMSARAAVAAIVPDHLRVELLNVLGQPMSSLAGDGQTLALLTVEDRKLRHFKQSSTALEPLIHIPIGVHELLDILMGRPPMPLYEAAQPQEAPPEQCAVVLKSRWNHPVAELRASTCDRLQTMQRFNTDGTLQYEVQWIEWQTVQGREVPYQIKVVSGSGDQVSLLIERMWTDVSLPSSLFVLEMPE